MGRLILSPANDLLGRRDPLPPRPVVIDDITPVRGLSEFWDAQAEWSQATFGVDGVRGPQGALKHLAKEVQEAMANPGDVFEFADMVFLVFDSARRAGFTKEQLIQACWEKLDINRRRKWKLGAPGEPSEHVRDEDVAVV